MDWLKILELMKITGVGKKVADCTLLFGMHRIEAFPIDVWMKRAMEKLFPNMNGDDFGQYAGIAQQYIFHYSRMHPELFLMENWKLKMENCGREDSLFFNKFNARL